MAPMEMRSHGIVPGVIQVPPGGQPIVQMRDAQPSGGYPKIGTVIEADLWRLGQAPIGSAIRFVPTTWTDAVTALEANRQWLTEARRLVGLWHESAGRDGTMNADLTLQLSAWLAATDIACLELRGPGVDLCLLNRGGQVESVPPGMARPGATASLPVTAASVGIYLHAHPVHEAPLATAGQPVVAGQPIGLLRVGALLLPVTAPHAGAVVRHLVAPSTVVGYGTPLAELIPSTPV